MSVDPLDFLRQAAAEAAPAVTPHRRRSFIELTDVSSKWAWTNDAACLHADPTIFFPDVTPPYPDEILDAANVYCHDCPVRGTCLDHALGTETEGIWAGTDPAGRRQMRAALGITDPNRSGRDTHDEVVGITPPLWELDTDHRTARDIANAAGVTMRTVQRHRAARRTQP